MKALVFICAHLCAICAICVPSHADLTLYTSVDEPYARPIVQRFEKETGIKVKLVTDAEAVKSIGLAERLRAEKDRPRCDVWWGNEPFHTVNLASEGLFEPYASPSAKDVRELFKDKEHRWAGNGIRARVIAVRAQYSASPEMRNPTILDHLLHPSLKGQIVMGRPAVGTIGGHVAAIYALRGQAGGDAFFRGLKANDIVLVGGNSPVPQQIAAGNFWAGLTDNDDVSATKGNVTMVLPGQAEGMMGTLAIPTTVALIKRPDAQADSKKLVDYLLSADVEKLLIDAKFAGWSVRSTETEFNAMQIDYAAVAKSMPEAVRRAEAILEGRDPDAKN